MSKSGAGSAVPNDAKWRSLMELAGAVSVVLSLVFVGMELRHANDLSQAEAVNSINQMINDLSMSTMGDDELSELIGKLERGLLPEKDQLTPGQQLTVMNYYAIWMNIYEAAWKYMERGIIGPSESEAYLSAACVTFSEMPRSIIIWGKLKSAFAAGYVAHVEADCPPLGGADSL